MLLPLPDAERGKVKAEYPLTTFPVKDSWEYDAKALCNPSLAR
jgi:hypothetical protein